MRILYVISFFSIACISMNKEKPYRYLAWLGTLDTIKVIGYLYTGNYDEISWDKKTDTYSGFSYKHKHDKESNMRSLLGLTDKGIKPLSEDEARDRFIVMKKQQKKLK